MRKRLLSLLVIGFFISGYAEVNVNLSDYGIKANTGKSISQKIDKAIKQIYNSHKGEKINISFPEGRYDFYPEESVKKGYFISNHDQTSEKNIGISIEDVNNITFDFKGSEIICHGRMLPLAVVNTVGIEIKNLVVDFEEPHITQVTIKENSPEGIIFETATWVKSGIGKNGRFQAFGKGWINQPYFGMAFEPDSRHIVYRTSDIRTPLDSIKKLGKNIYLSYHWNDSRLLPGTVVTLRTGERPAPGIFLSEDKDIVLCDVKVHYAEGMGLLAELCENITLDGFNVCLRGDKDPRYFTTQADATHFSGCKGVIISKNGLYENMMDDAINVHGTYLKVVGRENNKTLLGRYMHGQSYGFDWGYEGDTVSFVRSNTMEICGGSNVLKSIEPVDFDEATNGVKEFRLTFIDEIPDEINSEDGYGIENLTWTPSVIFTDNIIRNNRARGCLFSTPKPTVVENNIFDHTSGTAVLLCGDCNGWYETGACRDVLISGNRFINSLSSLFQFTEAVISIYPVIPDLDRQNEYFHGGRNEKGIRIENNEFITFDNPLLYAKSTYGIRFTGNKLKYNNEYQPFHKNKYNLRFVKCSCVTIDKNEFGDDGPSVLFE